MSLPQIAIIRISDAKKIALPFYGNSVGTSMTLLADNIDPIKIAPNHYQLIDTGLAIALPIGLEAQVRSLKQSNDTGVYVMNAPLTIDAADRFEIKVCLYNASTESVIIKNKDPIALLVFSPAVRIQWNDVSTNHMGRAHSDDNEENAQNGEMPSQQENITQDMATHTDDGMPVEEEKQPEVVKKFEELENHFYDTHQPENDLFDKDTSDHE